MYGEFDEDAEDTISVRVSPLGITNVRKFGLTWEDQEFAEQT